MKWANTEAVIYIRLRNITGFCPTCSSSCSWFSLAQLSLQGLLPLLPGFLKAGTRLQVLDGSGLTSFVGWNGGCFWVCLCGSGRVLGASRSLGKKKHGNTKKKKGRSNAWAGIVQMQESLFRKGGIQQPQPTRCGRTKTFSPNISQTSNQASIKQKLPSSASERKPPCAPPTKKSLQLNNTTGFKPFKKTTK